MSAAPLARTGFKFVMMVRDGPDTGASFQLLPPRVTIGRGSDCNVVLNDPRVSRMAASIEFTMEQITLTDVSGRQATTVNGDIVQQASLKDGDVIRIGDTELTFFVEALQLASQRPLSLAHPNAPLGGSSDAYGGFASGPGPARAPHGVRTSSEGLHPRIKFFAIVGVVAIAFAALMMTEPKKTKKDTGPRTVEELQKEIESSEKRQDELRQKRVFKNDDEKTRFEEAQRHFNEGFRDYQKGQWVRAMRSFETARTIDPKHQLATRYFKLAEKEHDGMISNLTLEARRYREKNMWARCSAQFEKVLDMIPNKDDVKYKTAEALKKECDLQLDGRF